jgi:hypothetical protein
VRWRTSRTRSSFSVMFTGRLVAATNRRRG